VLWLMCDDESKRRRRTPLYGQELPKQQTHDDVIDKRKAWWGTKIRF
jgi:hypothetical protein